MQINHNQLIISYLQTKKLRKNVAFFDFDENELS